MNIEKMKKEGSSREIEEQELVLTEEYIKEIEKEQEKRHIYIAS